MKIKSIYFLATIFSVLLLSSCSKKATEQFIEQKDTSINNEINQEELEEEILELESAHANFTQIEFNKAVHDFGEIKEGDLVSTTFIIKNVGQKPLLLEKVSGSCGCTVPKIDTENAIQPNETREIKVQFNSANRVGEQLKFVKVFGNFEPSPSLLKIKGVVVARD